MIIGKKFEEEVFFTTTRITINKKSENSSSIGTGFLFSTPLNDGSGKNIILLISNKHVFTNPKEQISFSFNVKNGDQPDFGNIYTFHSEDFSGNYFEHPDPNIDLACINASAISKPNLNIYYKALNSELVSDFTDENLVPGLDVWFVGYPENRFDVTNNLPLLRRGYISSLPKISFNSKSQFVIDAQVFQGSSGSPVFAALNNHYKLIGVVTQTMIKHGKLQSIPTIHSEYIVQQTLGLGIVLKSTLIEELVDLAVSRVIEHIRAKK